MTGQAFEQGGAAASQSAAVFARSLKVVSPSTRIAFPPLVVASGNGYELADADGVRYLDMHAMACIMNTGYGHPVVRAAVDAQLDALMHANTAYVVHEPMVELSERLAALTPGDWDKRVALGLSGSDAADGAIKLARAATGRPGILTFRGAYHGNTYGALSVSSASMAMRTGFGPVLPDVHHLTFPDPYRGVHGVRGDAVVGACLDELDTMLSTTVDPGEVAALIVEPIQGDAGVVVPPDDYFARLQAVCHAYGILVIADEVQTGIGRTGRVFGSEVVGLEPDIVVLGKALGSGMPVSAIVARSELMDHWQAPGHVFSMGGNPVACAAAVATLDLLASDGLPDHARALGGHLRAAFDHLAGDHEIIGDVRGSGLLLGVDLVDDHDSRSRARSIAAKTVLGAFRRGVFVTFLQGSVIRVVPPLILDEAGADRFVEILDASLADATAGRIGDDEIAELQGW